MHHQIVQLAIGALASLLGGIMAGLESVIHGLPISPDLAGLSLTTAGALLVWIVAADLYLEDRP